MSFALLLASCASTSQQQNAARSSGSIAGTWVTVQRGDTLGEMAKQADVPLLRLQRFNPGVKSRGLAVGQRILVPYGTERAPSGGPYRYQIRSGDTFSKVARHFGTTSNAIIAANSQVNPSSLAIGQLVNVPLKQSTGKSRAVVASSRKSVTLPNPGPLPKTNSNWSWPLEDYNITRRFGKDSRGTLQPMLLSTSKGATAKAINDGEVRFADSMRQLGQVVIVHHDDNLQSVYANCKTLRVNSGANVKRGTPLCDVDVNERGQTELLFDMRHGGKPVDPSRLLQ
ncbi:LysM peptidoglycan-binding domain-containing protein [Halomonas halocynthiae]|uniref:LysM peptidoglycan-binding domain-containing protein n=1 Tax=Halomonas halocynthiae TaxID=176290 RepID=UPI001F0B3FB3|nr:LysM peptidoglycan-binding domain-containing protein [Halomonas halocynthiae]